jgi:hypothetical protein
MWTAMLGHMSLDLAVALSYRVTRVRECASKAAGDRMTNRQEVRRFCSFTCVLFFVGVMAVPIAANAIGVNVTGTWNLTVMTNSAPELHTGASDQVLCEWKGLMTLTQTGADFTGSVMLSLVAGPCLPTVSGTVQGSLGGTGSGFVINFGLASGEFGEASFDGIVSDDGQSAQGEWTNEDSGTWSAEKIRTAAPALSGNGLAVLFGLLLAAGTLFASRRAVRASTGG